MSDDQKKDMPVEHDHEHSACCGHDHQSDDKSEDTSWLSRLGLSWIRFGAAWLGIGGLWQMTNVCPFCGQPSCPGGWTFAGVIGLLGAMFFQFLRKLGRRTKNDGSRTGEASDSDTTG